MFNDSRIKPQTSVPIGSTIFAVKNQTYEVLRFEGNGPDSAAIQTITRRRGALLTLDEGKGIKEDPELNARFKDVLKPGEWAPLISPLQAFLGHGGDYRQLEVVNYWPSDSVQVLILKIDGEKRRMMERTRTLLRNTGLQMGDTDLARLVEDIHAD
jgi:hypothetical protein